MIERQIKIFEDRALQIKQQILATVNELFNIVGTILLSAEKVDDLKIRLAAIKKPEIVSEEKQTNEFIQQAKEAVAALKSLVSDCIKRKIGNNSDHFAFEGKCSAFEGFIGEFKAKTNDILTTQEFKKLSADKSKLPVTKKMTSLLKKLQVPDHVRKKRIFFNERYLAYRENMQSEEIEFGALSGVMTSFYSNLALETKPRMFAEKILSYSAFNIGADIHYDTLEQDIDRFNQHEVPANLKAAEEDLKTLTAIVKNKIIFEFIESPELVKFLQRQASLKCELVNDSIIKQINGILGFIHKHENDVKDLPPDKILQNADMKIRFNLLNAALAKIGADNVSPEIFAGIIREKIQSNYFALRAKQARAGEVKNADPMSTSTSRLMIGTLGRPTPISTSVPPMLDNSGTPIADPSPTDTPDLKSDQTVVDDKVAQADLDAAAAKSRQNKI